MLASLYVPYIRAQHTFAWHAASPPRSYTCMYGCIFVILVANRDNSSIFESTKRFAFRPYVHRKYFKNFMSVMWPWLKALYDISITTELSTDIWMCICVFTLILLFFYFSSIVLRPPCSYLSRHITNVLVLTSYDSLTASRGVVWCSVFSLFTGAKYTFESTDIYFFFVW